MRDETYLVTGSTDQSLKVWRLKWTDDDEKLADKTKALAIAQLEDSEGTEENNILQCHLMGSLLRGGRGRVVAMQTDVNSSVLVCHGTDSILEIFYFNEPEEAQARLKKRMKKAKKRRYTCVEYTD